MGESRSKNEVVHRCGMNEQRFNEKYGYLFDESVSPNLYDHLCEFKMNRPENKVMNERIKSIEDFVTELVRMRCGSFNHNDGDENVSKSSSRSVDTNASVNNEIKGCNSPQSRLSLSRKYSDRRETVDPSLLQEIFRSIDDKFPVVGEHEIECNDVDPDETRLSSSMTIDYSVMTPIANSSIIKLKRLASNSGKRGADLARVRLASTPLNSMSCTRIKNCHNTEKKSNYHLDLCDNTINTTNKSVTFHFEENEEFSSPSIEIARQSSIAEDNSCDNVTCDLELRFHSVDREADIKQFDEVENGPSFENLSTSFEYDYLRSSNNFEMIESLTQSPIKNRHSGEFSPISNSLSELDEGNNNNQIIEHQSRSKMAVRSTIATRMFTLDTVETSISKVAHDFEQIRCGSRFRMPPINLSRSSSSMLQQNWKQKSSMFDYERFLPTNVYSSRMVSYLEEIKNRINNDDDGEISDKINLQRKIISSLSLCQTQAIVLSMLDRIFYLDNNITEQSDLIGGTLIVLSHKDSIDSWQIALKEHSSCSVFNHGILSPSRRREVSISRCIGFDVVLTTADCIKAKEYTYQLNALGCIVNSLPEGGWFDSSKENNSNSNRKCLQLSMLHKITWRRVIFVDFPDGKSFLTKSNTLKSIAATAITSSSR